ncbi:MAG: hypothetical protein CME62_05460 [Halobacteriovoraceae bacterium]|nr:hypothetical protein [Halobacteriovoraceae bacterium]|tara:strand:+ start:3167 stop:3640 length:474 start_codon:yes stop_codon:yes gene_type:complete
MKTIFKNLLLFILLVMSARAFSSDLKYGVGGGAGSYAAISGEYILNDVASYDSALSFDIGDRRKLHLHVTRLFKKPESLKLEGQVMSWYYGLGVRYRTYEKKEDKDDYKVGARASVGLLYDIGSSPLKAFADAAVVLNIVPATDYDSNLLVGVRYYF